VYGQDIEVVLVACEDGGSKAEGIAEAAQGEHEVSLGEQYVRVGSKLVVGAEGLGGAGQLGGVGVLGQASDVEGTGELGSLLGQRGVVGDVDHVEVQRVEKLPLVLGGQQGIGHEGLEGLEALHVDLAGRLVAVLCAVERIELGVALSAQEAHSSLGLERGGIGGIALLACGHAAVGGGEGGGDGGRGGSGDLHMAQLGAGAGRGGDEVDRILVAEGAQGVVYLALLEQAVSSQVAALRGAVGEVAAGEQGVGALVVARRELDLGQPESVLIVA